MKRVAVAEKSNDSVPEGLKLVLFLESRMFSGDWKDLKTIFIEIKTFQFSLILDCVLFCNVALDYVSLH